MLDPKRLIGSFLFLGPTGVSKTELAHTLGKPDSQTAFKRDSGRYRGQRCHDSDGTGAGGGDAV